MTEPVFKSQAYFLVNQYISGIQCGIQAAHCAMELMHKEIEKDGYDFGSQESTFIKWLEEDKTMIVLNGGSQRDLMDVLELLKAHEWPYAYFNEEQDALNGALTCVGFVLDAKAVETIQRLRTGELDPKERAVDALFVKVSQLGLAR